MKNNILTNSNTYSLIKQFFIILLVALSLLFVNINKVAAVTYSNGQISIPNEDVYADPNIPTIANGIYGQLGVALNGFLGIALITLTLIFVIRCGQLAASADNAQKRSENINSLLWIGIAVGALGFFSAAGGVLSIIVSLTNGVN